MQNLIQDLLTYSRVSRLAYIREPVDTAEVVGDVVRSLGAEASVCVGADLPVVHGDGGQLQRVFQNLIANALKFVAPERAPCVEVSATRVADGWRFSVRDNGIGIDPQHHDRVFKMFQRLHSQDEYPGTGIGLAVCHRIVERHHGRIWVESTQETGGTVVPGTTFHFTLPERAELP
jgi:light-regulated signal transduction histidine kinase (bacteriophytochrome)